tara:strand:+ start:3683 stop:5548 length:1866 start_codon:yes stop_codon:yes gene_type:complete
MAPLPNLGNKVIAGAGSVGKALKDSVKDAVSTTAKAGIAGAIGPELFALKTAIGGGIGGIASTLSKNYNDLLNASNDNNRSLDLISKKLSKGEKNRGLSEILTDTENNVLDYLKQIADNTSYLAELKEDLAINQARNTLEMNTSPDLSTAANDNVPSDTEKKKMSPLLLAGLIIGGITSFATEFLKALRVGTLKWLKAIGKITGIGILLEKFGKAIKLDNIKTNLKLFYQNIANNISRFRTMSVEAFKGVRVTVGERLAAFRASIVQAFSKEGPLGKALAKIKGIPTTISEGVKGSFGRISTAIGDVFTKIKTYATNLTEKFKFKTITDPLDEAWKFIKDNPITRSLGTLGKLVGKILYPIGVALSLYDGFKEGKEEYTKSEGENFLTQFGNMFKGGVRGFLKSFVGIPLDLLKSALSWALGAFGFKEAEKFLDSFKFTEFIGKAVNSVYDFFYGICNSILELFALGADKIGADTLASKLRSMKYKSDSMKAVEEAEKVAGVDSLEGVGGSTLNRAGGEIISQNARRQSLIDGRRIDDLLKDYQLKNDKVFVDDLSSTVDKLGQAAKSIDRIANRVPDMISGGGVTQQNIGNAGNITNSKSTTIQYGGGYPSEPPFVIRPA